MSINCEMRDLRVFLAILDFGSFHKAAAHLNLSQPALSRRLQSLELELGAALFERSTRHVAPTRVGRELEPVIRKLVHDFEDCLFTVGDLGGKHSGQITIAAMPTAASALLPRVLKKFRQLYPGIGLRILDLSPKEGLECVARGEAEFCINSMGTSRPELKFTPLTDDLFVAACRPDHPFARQKSIRWNDLVGHPLIVSLRSDNRALIDQALARSDLRLDWSFQVGHLATSFGPRRSRRRHFDHSAAQPSGRKPSDDLRRTDHRSDRTTHRGDCGTPDRPVVARGVEASRAVVRGLRQRWTARAGDRQSGRSRCVSTAAEFTGARPLVDGGET